MLVQSTRPRNPAVLAEPVPEPRVAVLLNANAKRVTEKVIRRIGHVVAEEDLFVSREMADCERIARAVIDRRYTTVFTGGGDGTFMAFVNAIQAEMAKQGVARPPRFGVLKLGTGNALANLVGASALASDGILDDILRARANEVPSVRRLEMLTCEGKVAPFAGLGYDAALLNDYNALKKVANVAKPLVATQAGYLMALGLKTIPHYVMNPKPIQVEIVAEGRAMKLDSEGKAERIYAKGDVLFRGGLNVIAASTVPCYGFNFKMFPFVGKRRGMFQLRASSVSTLACVANLPSLWQGRWRHPDIHDFLAESATIRLEKPMPLQIGGDAEGERDAIALGLAERSYELVDFTPVLN